MTSSGNARRGALRPDTTVVEIGGRKVRELYLRQMPGCCLRSLKEAVVHGGESQERKDSLRCAECEREWHIVSSLDERVLGRFEVAREVGFGGPAA